MAAADPVQARQNAAIAAHERWAKSSARDRQDNGSRGQRGLRGKFETEIREAVPGLTETEYAVMAENKYTAHMIRLGKASAAARKARAGAA